MKRKTALTLARRSVSGLIALLLVLLLASAAVPVLAMVPEPGLVPGVVPGPSLTAGADHSIAKTRCGGARTLDDPVFGASSLAEAAFYAAGCSRRVAAHTGRSHSWVRCGAAQQLTDPLFAAWSIAETEFRLAECRSVAVAALYEAGDRF